MNNMNLLLIIKDELKRQDTERRETNQQSKAEQKKHTKKHKTHTKTQNRKLKIRETLAHTTNLG